MDIDLQLSAAVDSWPTLRDAARVAEAAGYGAVWVFDHFLGAMLGGTTVLDPFVLLGALAGTTERIRLGSLVLNVANRTPAVIATGAASVQTISGGRLLLGLGAGASPTSSWALEQHLLGHDVDLTAAERHARLIRTLDEIDRLWEADEPPLATAARPSPRPPVVLGVNSVTLASIAAARCDGINVRSDHERLDEIVAAATRDTQVRRAFDVSVWARWAEELLDSDHPERRRWSSLGVTRVILVWFEPVNIDALSRCPIAH